MRAILIGKDFYGSIIEAELTDENKIRGFNEYRIVSGDMVIDGETYTTCIGWSHKAILSGPEGEIELISGSANSVDFEPINMTQDEVAEFRDSYSGESLSSCEECGMYHNTEDYDRKWVIVGECTFLCKDCATVEELLEPINNPKDIFNAKDLTGMDTGGLEEIETLFVDSSGFGSSEERALTKDQCETRILELLDIHGPMKAGLTDIGQFQVYVTLFKAV